MSRKRARPQQQTTNNQDDVPNHQTRMNPSTNSPEQQPSPKRQKTPQKPSLSFNVHLVKPNITAKVSTFALNDLTSLFLYCFGSAMHNLPPWVELENYREIHRIVMIHMDQVDAVMLSRYQNTEKLLHRKREIQQRKLSARSTATGEVNSTPASRFWTNSNVGFCHEEKLFEKLFSQHFLLSTIFDMIHNKRFKSSKEKEEQRSYEYYHLRLLNRLFFREDWNISLEEEMEDSESDEDEQDMMLDDLPTPDISVDQDPDAMPVDSDGAPLMKSSTTDNNQSDPTQRTLENLILTEKELKIHGYPRGEVSPSTASSSHDATSPLPPMMTIKQYAEKYPPLNRKSSRFLWKEVALDCEMCLTSLGDEMTEISVVDFRTEQVLYRTRVRPYADIIDFRTHVTGFSKENFKTESYPSLVEVMSHLAGHMDENTILIGHSLEFDLRCMRLIHKRVVDSAVLYPHKFNLPFKNGLAMLAKHFLNFGRHQKQHDPSEDALMAARLVKRKLESLDPSFGVPMRMAKPLYQFCTTGNDSFCFIDRQDCLNIFPDDSRLCKKEAGRSEQVVESTKKALQNEKHRFIFCNLHHLHEEKNQDGQSSTQRHKKLDKLLKDVEDIMNAAPCQKPTLFVLVSGHGEIDIHSAEAKKGIVAFALKC